MIAQRPLQFHLWFFPFENGILFLFGYWLQLCSLLLILWTGLGPIRRAVYVIFEIVFTTLFTRAIYHSSYIAIFHLFIWPAKMHASVADFLSWSKTVHLLTETEWKKLCYQTHKCNCYISRELSFTTLKTEVSSQILHWNGTESMF